MKYDYLENMKEDIREYLKENDIEEISEDLFDTLWVEDSVTGNTSGSYYCNSYKAQQALQGNEDLVEEKLSGSNYQKMLDKYQDEQKKLNSQLVEIESKLTQENKTEANIETFKQIARKYIDFDELTPEIINNLISHITVSHVKVINGTKFREIKIIYKFIG